VHLVGYFRSYFTYVLHSLLRLLLLLNILSFIYNQFKRSNTILIIPRKMRWAGRVARMGQRGGTHAVLMREREGEGQRGRPTRRWEDNIKEDLQEAG
jgi:hypothetical protein